MDYIVTNGVAIVAATLAGLVVGAIYHAVLGRSGRLSAGLVATALVAEGWLAAILAGALILAPPAGPGPWVMALASAVVIWVGFVLPTVIVTDLHAGRAAGTAASHAAHWLAVMLAQAAVLQLIGLTKPV